MIRIVVRKKQRFAKNRLAVTMRNLRAQVGLGIFYQADHFFQVTLERLQSLVPGGRVRRTWRFRPIALRKSGRDMFRIAAEFENVPLRNPRMFQKLPARVWQSRDESAAFGFGEALDGVDEVNVRAAALQKVDEMFAQGFVVV